MLKLRKAFTLIELLVVIGIMAVLAAGVVALIDPVEKTRQATDSQVQNDIGQIATALQSYAAQQTDGSYPTTAQGLAYLATVGEFKSTPTAPTGYAAYSYTNNAGNVVLYGTLRSKKYTAAAVVQTYWTWCSTNNKICGVAVAGNCCP